MTDYPHHQSLRLQNFTVFRDVSLEFVPGINVLVGENGTGKTHLMKALYAQQLTRSRPNKYIRDTLEELFQTSDVSEIVRLQTGYAYVDGRYNGEKWNYLIINPQVNLVREALENPMERPIFIPAIDMMGHTKGFIAAANEIVLDFDLTCKDIVTLLALERRNGKSSLALTGISELLGGTLEYQDSSGRFYMATAQGRLPIPLVAEGLRKIATLVRLAQNGWLVPGTTLFWDEPEVNLNPKLMDEVIGAVLAIARSGVQVFLATHSYVILKELDLQATQTDSVRYFAFQPDDSGTIVHSTDTFALLEPNPILEQYDSLYDREITRTTGRNRNGERVR